MSVSRLWPAARAYTLEQQHYALPMSYVFHSSCTASHVQLRGPSWSVEPLPLVIECDSTVYGVRRESRSELTVLPYCCPLGTIALSRLRQQCPHAIPHASRALLLQGRKDATPAGRITFSRLC